VARGECNAAVVPSLVELVGDLKAAVVASVLEERGDLGGGAALLELVGVDRFRERSTDLLLLLARVVFGLAPGDSLLVGVVVIRVVD
jgi:hypothetical protein